MIRRFVIAAALSLFAAAALAMGAGGDLSKDPDFAGAMAAFEKKNWDEALIGFQRCLEKAEFKPSADMFNLMGYAARNLKRMDAAFDYYAKAIAIDPNHKGAHEYVGEAYLQVGNIAKAEEHLKILDKLCFFGCAEYTELKNAIAARKARGS
ncbi:MAG: hypothetical protein FJX47_03485 [Alphaproteobacteria bacterium]|nr:hypothetical protein [Alphaproteobacteria bacterium]